MSITEQIKVKVGEFYLRRKLKSNNRNVRSCNINKAKSLGILFNATQFSNFEKVKEFVKDYGSKECEITVLGFVDSKQMIDHYLYRKGFEFFTRTHLNWFHKPDNEAVTNFLNKEFDILIDLCLEDIYPIKYILNLSKAKFKVGVFEPEQTALDLMIDIENEKSAMKELQQELEKDKQSKKDHHTNFDAIANQKASTELQMNFLINQLSHYLGQIKN